MKKRITRNMMTLLLLFASSIVCFAQPSGSCGTDLTWKMELTTLTITGKGSMIDFSSNLTPGWKPYESIIKKIIVEDGVETIGNYAFAGLNNLETVILGKDVGSIGNNSFYECAKLVKINFPSSLSDIKDHAFYSVSIDSLLLPDSVRIGNYAFQNSHLLYVNVSGTIGNYAFRDNKNLKTVIIRDGTIGENAFSQCENMYSLEIQDGVTNIGLFAFYRCNKLKKLTIPSSVSRVGRAAFYQCDGLDELDIAAKIIDVDAFYYCMIPSILLREGVETIGRNAFNFYHHLNVLDTLFLPSTLSNLNLDLFSFTDFYHISFGVHDDNQFYSAEGGILFNKDKTALLSFPAKKTGHYSIPNTVELIGNYAFAENSLTSIEIPTSVKGIGDYAFGGSNLRVVEIPESVTKAGSGFFAALFTSNSIEKISLPKTLKSIPEWAFTGCAELNSVQISEGTTEIGQEAFMDCTKLKTIHFPSTVEYYKKGILNRCTALDSVIVSRQYPAAITADVFSEIDISKLTLVVPDGTKLMYEIANVWKDFGKIIEKPLVSNKPISPNVSVKLFPNPVDDYLIVERDDSCVGNNLNIFSTNGFIIYNRKITENRTLIDLSSYPKGIYIAIINGEAIKLIKK